MVDAGANFCKGVKNGNQISPKGSNRGSKVAELSRAEIEEEGIDPETELVIEELAEGAKVRELDEDEHYLKLDLDSDKADKFFSEDELSALESKERTLTGEPEPEKDISEVWENIREGVRKHNKEVAKKRRQMEIEQAKEELKKGTKYDRDVSSLSGEEFKELIAEANQNPNSDPKSEELEAAIDQIQQKYAPMLDESEPDIKDPSTEIEELDEGLQAWKEIGGVWEELANDVEACSEVADTEITTLESGKKLVKTSYPKLKEELQQVDENPDKDGKIVEKNGDVITAKVSEGDKF